MIFLFLDATYYKYVFWYLKVIIWTPCWNEVWIVRTSQFFNATFVVTDYISGIKNCSVKRLQRSHTSNFQTRDFHVSFSCIIIIYVDRYHYLQSTHITTSSQLAWKLNLQSTSPASTLFICHVLSHTIGEKTKLMQDYVLLKKENTRTGLLCLKSIFKSFKWFAFIWGTWLFKAGIIT